ncbi:protein FAR1-RELATED SEQUENCE 5 [Sorghum bicolor]|uniref:protein FAR1-RELATED SEQUENCE 5 n=1 Tax=Sorghum bicolor TaxID=4558 RepID=UPI000B426D36|nr:protein FAR1-RELATED SEQUENCE 5 [Sorghum bicolor]|eukprot:XP_021321743.1 protein FAR1-RELATED SEQUENCE 5 [Sorghum bicolor]
MRCHRYGKPSKKKTDEQEEEKQMNDEAKKKGAKRKTNIQVKTNYPVLMEVKIENDKWKVVRLELDHNHELSPQNRNKLFSGRKYMTDMEKAMIRTLNNNNIPTRQMIAILSYLRGNVTALPYKKKDVQNERTKINRELKGNDMNKVMQYFMQRAAEDQTFFYKIHVDEENKVKNIYWREGISQK